MQLIVPMAGLGSRFTDAGYATPKPLIPVAGRPMVVRVVEQLPPADHIVFVVHQDHVDNFGIDEALREHFPDCGVVCTPGLTEGQACTVNLASAAVDLNDDVLVAACDASHVYDRVAFTDLIRDPSVDGAIWTYRKECRVALKPVSFGWVEVKGEREVVRVSCKTPISEMPLNDHVISGFFWFRNAQQMFSAIDELVASDQRVNGEFYMDVVPNLFVEKDRRMVVFEVDKYVGWGTPEDLRDYECWEKHFASLNDWGQR